MVNEVKIYRSGYYGVINEQDYCIRYFDKGWKIYENNTPGSKPILIISKKEAKMKIESVYMVRTKAKYTGFIFPVFQNNALKNNKELRLFLNNLDFEAYEYFGFSYRDDEANIIVNEEDLQEIWEEREPLVSFNFKADPIKHLKNNSI